jgi:hypothetical protein
MDFDGLDPFEGRSGTPVRAIAALAFLQIDRREDSFVQTRKRFHLVPFFEFDESRPVPVAGPA